MGLPLHLSFFYAHSHPRPLSAEYGRIRRDLTHARPFLGPYILLIYLLLKKLVRTPAMYSADWLLPYKPQIPLFTIGSIFVSGMNPSVLSQP